MRTEPVELIGRAAELALINGAIGDFLAGRGRSLLIEGEPGIGKTALLSAGISGLPRDRCTVLRGSCDELGQRFPLSVMIRLLGVEQGSPDPRRAAAAAALQQPGSAGWAVRIAACDPVAAAIEQLAELVDRLCGSDPLVVELEDLQWADDATVMLWRRLSRAAVQLPLLLLGTCRPAPRRAQLYRLRRELVASKGLLITLGPLNDADAAQLATRHAGGLPGPGLRQRLESAAGNPLYVEELVSVLSRSGSLRLTDGAAELVASGEPGSAATSSLVAAIADRLEFLSAAARDLLRSATLLGQQFSVSELAAASNGALIDVLALVQEALDASVLESRGARLRFRHGLLKEAVYEAMPHAVRVALHQHAAKALFDAGASADRVAEVLPTTSWAMAAWELDWLASNAAELSERAPQIASGLLETALHQTDPTSRRYVVFADRLAAVHARLGQHEQTIHVTRDILARSSDPEHVGHAVWLLGSALLERDEVEDAGKIVQKHLTSNQVEGKWAARIEALRSEVLVRQVRFTEARLASDRAAAAGSTYHDAAATAFALRVASTVSMHQGNLTRALDQIDRALSLTTAQPELTGLRVLLLGERAPLVDELCRPAEAVEALRQARVLGERTASPQLDGIHLRAAEMAYLCGDWDDTSTELESLTTAPEQSPYILRCHALSAVVALRRDDRPGAANHLAICGDHNVQPGASWSAGYMLAAQALSHEQNGNPQRALSVLGQLLSPENAMMRPGLCYWLTMLVRTAVSLGEHEQAADATEMCQRRAEQAPRPGNVAAAQWCTGLLTGDSVTLLAATDFYRAVCRRPDLGNALEDAAILLAAEGDHAGARHRLGEALTLYASIGAIWDTRRARARARQFGIRPGERGPRRRPATGWSALTPTELRVADLLALGRTNPDIAAELLITRHTVESHVKNILSKLGLRSRREIGQARDRVTTEQ